jgi:hypothetical protein
MNTSKNIILILLLLLFASSCTQLGTLQKKQQSYSMQAVFYYSVPYELTLNKDGSFVIIVNNNYYDPFPCLAGKWRKTKKGKIHFYDMYECSHEVIDIGNPAVYFSFSPDTAQQISIKVGGKWAETYNDDDKKKLLEYANKIVFNQQDTLGQVVNCPDLLLDKSTEYLIDYDKKLNFIEFQPEEAYKIPYPDTNLTYQVNITLYYGSSNIPYYAQDELWHSPYPITPPIECEQVNDFMFCEGLEFITSINPARVKILKQTSKEEKGKKHEHSYHKCNED